MTGRQSKTLPNSACPGTRDAAAPWLNWIEQPPPKGQVTGSSPVGVTKHAKRTQAVLDKSRCCDSPGNRQISESPLIQRLEQQIANRIDVSCSAFSQMLSELPGPAAESG